MCVLLDLRTCGVTATLCAQNDHSNSNRMCRFLRAVYDLVKSVYYYAAGEVVTALLSTDREPQYVGGARTLAVMSPNTIRVEKYYRECLNQH